MPKLIAQGFLSLHEQQEENDKIIVYFNGDVPKHFGSIDGNKIMSKWEERGHVWSHGIWEVPLSYGESVRYATDDVDLTALEKIIDEEIKEKQSGGG